MRKLFHLFLLFTPFVNAQDYAMSKADFEMHYPLPKDGKWCISSSSDSAVPVSKLYDTIHFCSSISGFPYFLAISENTYQLFDPGLEELSRGNYFDFLCHNDVLYIQRKNDWLEISLLTSQEKLIQADSIVAIDQIIYVFKNHKMGLIEYQTNIPPIYDRIAPFVDPNTAYSDDIYLVLNDGRFGVINQDGEVVIPPVASIVQLGKFGIIKYKVGTWKYLLPNKTILEPNGKEIHFYSDNLYKIYNSYRTKATLYENEEVIIKIGKYDDVFPLYGFWAVRKNGKIGLLNEKYDLIKEPFCDQIEVTHDFIVTSESEHIAYLKYLIGDKWGLMDRKGQIIFSANYSNILEVIETKGGLDIKIAIDGYVGVINESEEVIIPVEYDNVVRSGKGYTVQRNQLVGYRNSVGDEILKTSYTGYRRALAFGLSENSLMAFQNVKTITFVNMEAEILPLLPCIDFSYGNDMLKCYYFDRIEVHVIENGKITETTKYPQIRKVQFISSLKRANRYGRLGGFNETTLELNQQSGLYGARFKLKNGMGLKPTYPHCQESVFNDFFDGGTFEDSVLVFQFRNFPMLKTYRVFNWMNQSDGSFENDVILSSRIFILNDWYGGSCDCSVLRATRDMTWISPNKKDRIDPLIATNGLLYDERIDQIYQKVYVGGEFEFVPISDADISMMDYFNYLNNGRNVWFTSTEEAMLIMDPTKGVRFSKGKLAIRDTRDSWRVPFKYDVSEFKELGVFYAFKKEKGTTWNLCKDLETKDKFIENILSAEESSLNYGLIVEKKVGQTSKKAIYNIEMEAETKFLYDDIIPAGGFGYLVRIGQKYSYIL